jgi:hypothetical protein
MVDLSKIADALADGRLLICKEQSGTEIPPDSLAAVVAALRAQPEGELLKALELARLFIRREQIEHAVVDVNNPNVGLGAYLDGVIARHGPQKGGDGD